MKTIYLDNAATTKTPEKVIQAMVEYYRDYRASVHRGLYEEAVEATELFEESRTIIADHIRAASHEIIFTKGTTESLNMVAQRIGETLGEEDEVLLTEMEHHANIVPWQEMAKRRRFSIKWIPVKDYALDMDAYRALLSEKTKVVAVTHVSNVLGTVNPVKEIGRLAHEVGAIVVVDAAQSVPHMHIDVKDMDCDFLAFSGHKMHGPTGIGVLYGKEERLSAMEPFLYGGHMIRSVTKEGAEWADAPAKFEAGTPPIAEVFGLVSAIFEFDRNSDSGHTIVEVPATQEAPMTLVCEPMIENVIEKHSRALAKYATEKLSSMDGIRVIAGPEPLGLVSFVVDGMHPHDVSELLAREGIAVRGGHHCAMPLMQALGLEGTTRASFSYETTMEDIDALVRAIKKAQEVFAK